MLQFFLLGVVLWQSATTDNNNVHTDKDTGLFALALKFVQTFGTQNSASPENDLALKSAVAQSIYQKKEIAADDITGLVNAETFRKLAGDDNIMTADEMAAALKQAAPKSRNQLLPALREHAEYLTTTYDMISESKFESSRKLANWIAENYSSEKSLHVIIVCTGNSRRSIMGACMGNMAAAYYGMDNLRFHSGGTAPSAFNRRTIASLKAIGFEIAPTGEEAERGEPKTANPKYRVVWGNGLDSLEYSKRFMDASKPTSGFAAIMVCAEADSECPTVPGAVLRLSMPFLDPKSYDDSKYETAKYAERRDDIGRTMLAVLAMASKKVN